MFAQPNTSTEPTRQTPATRSIANSGFHSARSERSIPPNQRSNRSSRILRDATRDFSQNPRPSREEIERYKELFYQIVDRLEVGDLRLVSAMLARSAYTPRPVALYLAQDAVEVAAPMLLFSPVLNDLDLRAIAAKRGKLYADIIRKRQIPLDKATKHALKNTPEAPVQATPTANSSDIGEKTEDGTSVRSDLMKMASRGGKLGRDTVGAKQTPSAPEVSLTQKATDFRLPKSEIRKLLSLARKRDFAAISALIEDFCALEAKATARLLASSRSDEPLYLIRALGIPAPHDIQLAMLIQPEIARSIEGYRKAKNTLAELNQGICQIIFNEIGARFEPTKSVTLPASSKRHMDTKSTLREALASRRHALQKRHEATDRFAAGPGDRWPEASHPLEMAG